MATVVAQGLGSTATVLLGVLGPVVGWGASSVQRIVHDRRAKHAKEESAAAAKRQAEEQSFQEAVTLGLAELQKELTAQRLEMAELRGKVEARAEFSEILQAQTRPPTTRSRQSDRGT